MDSTLETPVNAQPNSPEPSPSLSENSSDVNAAERQQLKGLLAEARQTREMLTDFEAAIKNGTFQGHQMLQIAKGLAFLIAILQQNKAHIKNLQERVGEKNA